MERGAVAAVPWHPEDAAAMVVGANARMAGAGDGGWCGEQAPCRHGACSGKMRDGAACMHGTSLAWEFRIVKRMGRKMRGDIIDSMDGW